MLEELGCLVLHGIDATTMSRDCTLSAMKFDRVVFNFPHAGFLFRETSNIQIEMHKSLLEGFLRNARELVSSEHGEVHVTHKRGHPYSNWELEKTAEENGFVLVEASPCSLSGYPGYINKRGAGYHADETFPVRCASTFRFKIDAGLVVSPDLRLSQLVTDEICAEYVHDRSSAADPIEDGGHKDIGPTLTAMSAATNDSEEDAGPTLETTTEGADNKSRDADHKSTATSKLLIKVLNLLLNFVVTPFD